MRDVLGRRVGPPQSFGWLMIERGSDLDVWELPTGYRVTLDKCAWLRQDDNGYITPITPSTPPQQESA
jgi:hypothetical protein